MILEIFFVSTSQTRRFLFNVLIIIGAILAFSVLHEQNKSASSVLQSDDKEPWCKFPLQSIDDLLTKPRLVGSLKCNKEKNWVYTIGDGKFYVSRDAINRHGLIKCDYWRIDLINDNDYKEEFMGTCQNGTRFDGDSFRVKCIATDNSVYENFHISVSNPSKEIRDRIRKASSRLSESVNVFLYSLNSVSRTQFMRKLPKFYSLLTETMQAYVMEGFTSVGNGTIVPILTGRFQEELTESSFADDWPLLFENYSKAGYVTSFAEEQPSLSTFNFQLNGFRKTPVDHYLRKMLSALDDHPCSGDTPRSILWCNYWRELQIMYKSIGGRHLSVMLTGELESVQSMDEHWSNSFGELYRQNYFNNTLLIIFGDQGRRSQVNKVEEKMPFLAVVAPPRFRIQYPHFDLNLRKNRNRLTTPFDLHATLINVLDLQNNKSWNDSTKHGISLFREIPLERTCDQAQIKSQLCPCLNQSEPITNRAIKNKYCYKENSSTIIFLHLTDEFDQWHSLEMCAFKSAAITNPEAGVCVLTMSRMQRHPKLATLENLEFALLNISLIFENTPIAQWYENYVLDATNSSDYVLWEFSDALRLSYLYNYGGKYLDTDCITFKNLGKLKNVVGREHEKSLGNAVLFFDKHHPWIKAVLDNFLKAFRPGVWGTVGPRLITKVHEDGLVDNSTYTVLDPIAFFPTHYTQFLLPFAPEDNEKLKEMTNGSYVIHLWRSMIKKYWQFETPLPTDSFVEEFMNSYCN